MSRRSLGPLLARIWVLCFALVLATSLVGCSESASEPDTGDTGSGDQSAQEAPAEEPEEPTYTSWQVYINDDDSYAEGTITYSIALNFTATNPTADPAGAYSGTATASTGTSGQVNGVQLEAQAIAQSGNLQFTLEDTTAGGALAPLTEDTAAYTGTGTITMSASGSGTIGGAGGGFSNTSSQQITVSVTGSEATLKVPINGHEYTFTGTLTGVEASE